MIETNIFQPILQQRTYRKISQLSKELDMKRKRLERFVQGALSTEDLTVSEYPPCRIMIPFKDLFTGKSTVKKEYTLRRGVTFYEDKERIRLGSGGKIHFACVS